MINRIKIANNIGPYERSLRPYLYSASLQKPPGERVVIVNPTGLMPPAPFSAVPAVWSISH